MVRGENVKNTNKSIAFSKEIGILWDTIYSLHIQHNMAYFCRLAEKNSAVLNALKVLEQDVEPIKFTEISPFFYRLHDGMSFMLLYLNKYLDSQRTVDEMSVKQFWTYLQNDGMLVPQLLVYYFPELTETDIKERKNTPQKIIRTIREAEDMDSTIKVDLIDMIFNEEESIQKLLGEILSRETSMKEQHGQKAEEFAELQLTFCTESMELFLVNEPRCNLNLKSYQNWVITFTTFPTNLVNVYLKPDNLLLLLGLQYRQTIEDADMLRNKVDLQSVGAALAEKNRLGFLDYLLEKGEATGKDFERDFHLTGTNTYYHLSYLTRAGILKTYNRGRNLVYSIDSDAIRAIKECLTRYEGR